MGTRIQLRKCTSPQFLVANYIKTFIPVNQSQFPLTIHWYWWMIATSQLMIACIMVCSIKVGDNFLEIVHSKLIVIISDICNHTMTNHCSTRIWREFSKIHTIWEVILIQGLQNDGIRFSCILLIIVENIRQVHVPIFVLYVCVADVVHCATFLQTSRFDFVQWFLFQVSLNTILIFLGIDIIGNNLAQARIISRCISNGNAIRFHKYIFCFLWHILHPINSTIEWRSLCLGCCQIETKENMCAFVLVTLSTKSDFSCILKRQEKVIECMRDY